MPRSGSDILPVGFSEVPYFAYKISDQHLSTHMLDSSLLIYYNDDSNLNIKYKIPNSSEFMQALKTNSK